MADKPAKTVGPGTRPVPMKLFAAWELEKTAPNCVPRLCSFRLSRLKLIKPVENDLNAVIIAVKMQNSKRVLRSNEILVPPGGILDTELDLSFSLQYAHYIKRDCNKLQVMLQRRKRYRKQTILGYKTLAIGQVNMAHVLQRSMDKEMQLYSNDKESTHLLAIVMMLSLSSQPVDQLVNGQRKIASSDVDRSPDIDNESYDDEDQEDSSNDDMMSDSEPAMLDGEGIPRKPSRSKIRGPVSARGRQQRNFRQRFVDLLKRFKISEEALDSEADHELGHFDTVQDPGDDDFELDDIEDLSDSGPEMDTVSVVSTPKPRLKPFFQAMSVNVESQDSSKEVDKLSDDGSSLKRDSDSIAMELLSSNTHIELDPDMNSAHPSPQFKVRASLTAPQDKDKISRGRSRSYREKKNLKDEKTKILRRHSAGPVQGSPRKVLLDQLSVVLGGSDDKLPDHVVLVNTAEWQGQLMVQKLQEKQVQTICTCGDSDVKATISALVSKIQKFCNSNSKAPAPIKVGIAGGDGYINSVLRPYVDQFSVKSPDWQSYIKFLFIPFGNSCIGRYLGFVDTTYSTLFLDPLWKETFEKPEISKLDSQEIVNRVSKYLSGATGVMQVPIAEAMVMCKSKGGDEESTQIFIPFLSEVKIGNPDLMNASIDMEDGNIASSQMVNSPSLSSSPPSSFLDKPKTDISTPPSSPNVSLNSANSSQGPLSNVTPTLPGEFMELQVDYWTLASKPDSTEKSDKASKKDSNKITLKTTFKSLHVQRLAQSGMSSEFPTTVFSMVVVTKEKKQKIMRIGKKAKETESKSQVVEGINRLICTTKSQNYGLKVCVDGVEWTGVKFFQLSSQWQTHIKQFPIAIFNGHDPL